MNHEMILLIAGGAAATYLTRFPLMLLAGRRKVPEKLAKWMNYIAPAVMTSLIVPAVFIKHGRLDFTLANDYMIAAVITAISAYFIRNMLMTILVGLVSVGILSLF